MNRRYRVDSLFHHNRFLDQQVDSITDLKPLSIAHHGKSNLL